MFTLIVGGTALTIAAIAAFFSIKGISLLFSGSFWAVMLMAGSLEIGKLVAASALYRLYDNLNKIIKIYLFSALAILMLITSLGIFGFLSDAYNKSKFRYEIHSSQTRFVEEKKASLLNKLDLNKERLQSLTSIRKSQEERMSSIASQATSTTTSKKGGLFSSEQTFTSIDNKALQNKSQLMESATKDIESVNLQIVSVNQENESLVKQIEDINKELLDLKEKESKVSDIGTFKFIANAFNMELDTAVKWFIIMLVFVFDPLAIVLLIVYNSLIKKKAIM